MPRETHAPGPKTHVTPLQRYISTLLTCKVTLGKFWKRYERLIHHFQSHFRRKKVM